MFKILSIVLLLTVAASATPAVRHRWQINANRLVPEIIRGEGRIVGGDNTNIEQVPHQVVLHFNRGFTCGGSILNLDTILSAAHCTFGRSHANFQILVGQTNRFVGELIDVFRVIEHEAYNDWTLENDVVILKLGQDLVEGTTIHRVQLPPPNYFIPSGTNLIVSGFGTMQWGTSQFPDILQSVEVPSWTNAACQEIYPDEEILEQHLCAGAVGRDACQGDSGGPLTEHFGSPGAMVVGVVSWGYYCAREYPSVYARVSYFLGFILNNMAPN